MIKIVVFAGGKKMKTQELENDIKTLKDCSKAYSEFLTLCKGLTQDMDKNIQNLQQVRDELNKRQEMRRKHNEIFEEFSNKLKDTLALAEELLQAKRANRQNKEEV